MCLLYGALWWRAPCILTYGLDPRADRAALEAAAKRAGIQQQGRDRRAGGSAPQGARHRGRGQGLHSRELKARLDRICQQARDDPGASSSRTRRTCPAPGASWSPISTGRATWSRKYAAQQRDLADTALAENFRRVLTTVEQVFAEQEEVLKQDDKLESRGPDRGAGDPAQARGRALSRPETRSARRERYAMAQDTTTTAARR